jgi:hypothetical protein
LLKSMPGTRCAVQKATCSVSAKKLSGLRLSTILPTTRSGTSSSGTSLVGSSTSKLKLELGLFLGEDLQRQLVLGAVAALDGFPQVAAVEVGVGAADLHRLVPHQRVRAGQGQPVELHEARFTGLIDQPVGVDAETLHRAVAARDAAVAHHPQRVVDGLGHQRDEVPERVVRAAGLRHAVVRLGLDGMDDVGELHRVLDEEHRDVVAHQVPVALFGIELDGEAARVAHGVGIEPRSPATVEKRTNTGVRLPASDSRSARVTSACDS